LPEISSPLLDYQPVATFTKKCGATVDFIIYDLPVSSVPPRHRF
jgi:hypothetical protein